jgi:ABC-type multidrug transport system ATPase subunit
MIAVNLRLTHNVGVQELTHKADTRIGEDIDGRVSGVSGGERRRVSVGIGLVTDPRVIFLDEPTTGLDSDSALSLVKVLKRLAQRGRTVGFPLIWTLLKAIS